MRPRARDLGIRIGTLPPGHYNAITDVPGVLVGHTTLIEGAGPLIPGVGPVRTGVTVIRPHPGDVFRDKVTAHVQSLNGFGEVTNAEQVREMGVIESPIFLTGTWNVPRVADAALEWALQRDPAMGVTTWGPSPIVAECSDSYLSDVRSRPVRAKHVFAALESAAGGPVAEGGVGGGTGMSCCDFKGGIGTSSRRVNTRAGDFTLGVLVMSNFGRREHLRVDGVPVGRELANWKPAPPDADPEEQGSSIILVLGTDAPLDPRQLQRVAVRAGAGLARAGGFYSTSSGDFVIAFSTTDRVPHHPPEPVLWQNRIAESLLAGQEWPEAPLINLLFQAAIEAAEEAILNCLFSAETMVGRDDHVRHALPIAETVAILRRYGHTEVRLPG